MHVSFLGWQTKRSFFGKEMVVVIETDVLMSKD